MRMAGGARRKRFRFSKATKSAYRRNKRRGVTRFKGNVKLGKGFPKKMTVTHKYAEQVTVTATTGLFTTYQFSCNGMYDPNSSGTGHQPYYFDQLSALYDHYHVIGSKIKVTVIPNANNEDAFKWGVFINDDTSTTAGDITAVQENSSGTVRVTPANANNVQRMTKRWSAKKAFGGSIMGNDSLKGTPSTNPSEQQYYTVAIQPMSAATVVTYLDVEIEYIAVWNEIKDIAQS